MLLTALRRWSRCCSYSVWLCGLYYGLLHVLKSSRALCPRVSHSFQHCDHLAWGKGSWSVCFSCICLFVLYVLVFVIFVFLLVSDVGCGLLLWHSLDVSINFFAKKSYHRSFLPKRGYMYKHPIDSLTDLFPVNKRMKVGPMGDSVWFG